MVRYKSDLKSDPLPPGMRGQDAHADPRATAILAVNWHGRDARATSWRGDYG